MRSPAHVNTLQQAVADGTIDAIQSGHMPRAREKKGNDLDQAPFGAATLETTLAAVITDMIRTNILSWSRAIECLSTNPAKIAKLPAGTLGIGAHADVVVIDPQSCWTVRPNEFMSKCQSSPMEGRDLFGRVTHTIVGGRLLFVCVEESAIVV
jgi:dihydroorotase